MINYLKRTIVENFDDGTQVSKLPDNQEIVNKINEIIKYINNNEKLKENEFIKNAFKSRKVY